MVGTAGAFLWCRKINAETRPFLRWLWNFRVAGFVQYTFEEEISEVE